MEEERRQRENAETQNGNQVTQAQLQMREERDYWKNKNHECELLLQDLFQRHQKQQAESSIHVNPVETQTSSSAEEDQNDEIDGISQGDSSSSAEEDQNDEIDGISQG